MLLYFSIFLVLIQILKIALHLQLSQNIDFISQEPILHLIVSTSHSPTPFCIYMCLYIYKHMYVYYVYIYMYILYFLFPFIH